MNFQVQQIPRVRQLHKIGEVGKCNYLSMTYSLSNNCTKNYYNRTLIVQVIVKVVVTWIFLRHNVEGNLGKCIRPMTNECCHIIG